MSMLAEPGTRLAGRYRLQERVSEFNGSTLWRAIDEPLARPVAVRTFGADSSDLGRVIAAARAASRVADSRLAQVFDADESAPQPYLVCEWIDGNRLIDLIANGPLEAQHAHRFLSEAAEALVAAHAAGLSHQRLDPTSLVWAKGGTVKITGLAIDAALHGLDPEGDASRADARALGALCYATLTAYWAGETDVGLPPAPRADDGSPVPVGSVHPDIPPALAAIATRALGLSVDEAPPLDTPEEIRDALARLPRLAPLAPSPGRAPQSSHRAATGGWDRVAHPAPTGAHRPPGETAPSSVRGGRRPARVLLLTAVGVLILAATALGAWEIGRTIDSAGNGNGTPSSGQTGGGQPVQTQALMVSDIQDYDPFEGDDNPATLGDAHPQEVPHAVDGKGKTLWTTQTYDGANLGNLKPGVGLMLDMGDPTAVARVQVQLSGQGTTLELYAGNSSGIDQMDRVATVSGASENVELDPGQPIRARYLLVWITKLPPVSDGYRAGIAEIAVYGTTE